jgi:predicted DNA-binding transcriptional regulator AlpA
MENAIKNVATNVTYLVNPTLSQTISAQEKEEKEQGFLMMGLAGLPSNALLGEKALAAVLDVSTRTLHRMVVRGQMPQGVKLGGRRVWMVGKIIEYLAAEAERLAMEARKLSMRMVQGRL